MRGDRWKPPYGSHRYCMRHLEANFSSHATNKTVIPLVPRLVCAHNKYKFKKIWEKMETKYPEGTEWLSRVPKASWTLSHDNNGRRWGLTTSNNAEIMNYVFKGIRKLPVTAIVMATFYKLNCYHVRYRADAESRDKQWSDMVMEKMERRRTKAATHIVTCYNLDEGVYQVETRPRRTTSGIGIPGKTWEVNFNEGNCGCQKPMIYHYPCSHIISVGMHKVVSPEPFIHPCYSLDNLKHTYERSFYPVKERSHWRPRAEVCNFRLYPGDKLVRKDSNGRMKRGRRREIRFKNSMDTMHTSVRANCCSVCKLPGHTKPRCTQRGGGRYNGPFSNVCPFKYRFSFVGNKRTI